MEMSEISGNHTILTYFTFVRHLSGFPRFKFSILSRSDPQIDFVQGDLRTNDHDFDQFDGYSGGCLQI